MGDTTIISGCLNELKQQIIYRIELNYPRIHKCLLNLNDIEICSRVNENSNSIANLILHLCGNITQYIISGLGGNEDKRFREGEFAEKKDIKIAELDKMIKETAENAVGIISALGENDLLKIYPVQGYKLNGIAILIHVTEHYSYHTGQIVSTTKALKNIDTGFYKGMNLNKKNNSI